MSKLNEAHFHTLFYVIVASCGIEARTEVLSSTGRIDMVIEIGTGNVGVGTYEGEVLNSTLDGAIPADLPRFQSVEALFDEILEQYEITQQPDYSEVIGAVFGPFYQNYNPEEKLHHLLLAMLADMVGEGEYQGNILADNLLLYFQ